MPPVSAVASSSRRYRIKVHRKEYGCKKQEPNDFALFMKYLVILLALSATTTLYADTYEGKNGKAAHNRHGTAVQTSNGTAVHAKGSSAVHTTNGAYHANGTNGAVHTNRRAVYTNANWNDSYWHSNKYGYWNGQRGYWHVVSGQHVFVVVN
jgi:hypothetical protein